MREGGEDGKLSGGEVTGIMRFVTLTLFGWGESKKLRYLYTVDFIERFISQFHSSFIIPMSFAILYQRFVVAIFHRPHQP